MSTLVEQSCISCGDEFTDLEPDYCCSGGDCGCQGFPIDPPLCESCAIAFYGNNLTNGELK